MQLIVEFAKGLPAFIKIPQEDQITLLKVCLFVCNIVVSIEVKRNEKKIIKKILCDFRLAPVKL